MGEEQETKSSITGLFRKIAKNADTDNSNNLIESIYKSKNGGHDIDEVEALEESKPQEEKESLGVNSILAVAESKEIKTVQNAQPPITTTNNTNITNEAAIKNTLNELMQMGKGLTAEQIREKIAKVAAQNAANNNMAPQSTNESDTKQNENNITDNMPEWKKMLYEKRMQNSNSNLQGQNQGNAYNYQTTNGNSTVNNTKPTEEQKKKDIFEETFANFTLVPPKKTGIPQTEIKNTTSNVKVIDSIGQSNMVSDKNENYETKIISTDEINKLSKEGQKNEVPEEGQKPGDILLSILQDREQKEEIPSVPAGQFDDMYAQIFGSTTSKEKTEGREEEERSSANDIVVSNMNIFEEEEEFKGQIPYKLIGIAFRTYIILEIQNELYILDQHAAHERIMYEKVKENYYSEDNKDSQLMLLPDVITLTHKEMDIARENMDKFRKAGFVLEEFGDNTIKLTGVPNICLELDTKELFLETLDEINTVARTAKQEIEERFIATIACKAAVKANMALTNEEVESLLEKLLKLPNPFTCPHGRPTAIKLSKTDIEKKFARRK